MQPKRNKYKKKISDLKKNLFRGDYKEILAIITKSDESVDYNDILSFFNNRGINEVKIVKIIAATEELIASRKKEAPVEV